MNFFNIKNLFNINFYKRIFSAVIFIPIMIAPILLGGIYVVFTYLLLLSLVVSELLNILKYTNNKSSLLMYLLISIVSLFIFLLLLISDPDNRYHFIILIFTIWIFDTFSYLGGKIFNGRKLFPSISKGKTYSGLISGFASVTIFSMITSYYFNLQLSYLITLGVFISLFAFIGDMLVSLIKRSANLKDSGSIMPGHGGILDRLDSFIFVFFIISTYKIVIFFL